MQCKTPVAHNYGSVKHGAIRCAYGMGFFAYGGSNGVTAILFT